MKGKFCLKKIPQIYDSSAACTHTSWNNDTVDISAALPACLKDKSMFSILIVMCILYFYKAVK